VRLYFAGSAAHAAAKAMSLKRSLRRWSIGLLAITLVGASSGCVHVRPYQRERLAHATMTSGEWGGPAAGHARAVQEGAIGGGTAGEAGCGCN
jgi:hypothetical protein